MHGSEMASNEYKLFVGNIPVGTAFEELSGVFKHYGEPDEIHLVPKAGSKGMQYAFVRYPRKEMADAAIEALNGKHTLSTSTVPLVVRFSEKSRNSGGPGGAPTAPGASPFGDAALQDGFKLFVGNLPLSIQKEQIQELFQQYGEIREVVMLKAGRGTHLSAFVKFMTEAQAMAAIDALDGKHQMQDTNTGFPTTIQVRPRYEGGPRYEGARNNHSGGGGYGGGGM
eukprot:3933394-Rhodomonas_salina.1